MQSSNYTSAITKQCLAGSLFPWEITAKGQKQRQNEAVCLNASWTQGELGQSGPNALVDPIETIVFNHSLSHTRNHETHKTQAQASHTAVHQAVSPSQSMNHHPAQQSHVAQDHAGQSSRRRMSSSPTLQKTGPEPSLKKCNVAVWACWSQASVKGGLVGAVGVTFVILGSDKGCEAAPVQPRSVSALQYSKGL